MKVCLEVLCNFSDQSGHTQFSAQQLSALLIPPDLVKCHCAWEILVAFLDGSCKRRLLLELLGRQLLLRSFPSILLILIQIRVLPTALSIVLIIWIIIIRWWPFFHSRCRLCSSSSQGGEPLGAPPPGAAPARGATPPPPQPIPFSSLIPLLFTFDVFFIFILISETH